MPRDLNNAILLASRLLYPMLSYPILTLHYVALHDTRTDAGEVGGETVLEQHGDLLFSLWKMCYPEETEEASRNIYIYFNSTWYIGVLYSI